jgi:hypothetical protein
MNQLANIEQLETDLWAAADNLRANSKLTSSEYCMPVLGIIFLRHAANRYEDAVKQIAADQVAGKMARRAPIKADFLKRRALMLPREARYAEPAQAARRRQSRFRSRQGDGCHRARFRAAAQSASQGLRQIRERPA